MDETTTLQEATEADAAAIRRLTREAYAKSIPASGREPTPMTVDYDEAVRRNRFDLLFVGGALAGLIETADETRQLLIVNVAVAPSFQGRGLGTKLMAIADEIARSLGRRRIRLYTNQRWQENVRLYLKLGYRIDSEELIDGGMFRVNMSKDLGP
jgi:ribosomal protein S18 acetylase RimI-like enzyme